MRSVKFVIFLLCVSVANMSFACTDFQVKAQDGSVIIGRSMDFSVPVESKVVVFPRGYEFGSDTPDGDDGLEWVSEYGFAGLNAFGIDVVIDGINEEGLSVGLLWLPGTKYQKVRKEEAGKALSNLDLATWMLGNFATVEEVKEAITGVKVWGELLPQLGIVAPLHVAVHDDTGKSLVIEYIDGKVKVYDNPVGVLTNAPAFDWHMTNLRNYPGITSYNAEPVVVGNVTFQGPGQGSGYAGIPGDWTPSARFVRAAAFTHLSGPASNGEEGVILTQHILNAVDVPKGAIKEEESGQLKEDHTQWAVVKDLRNRVLHFRTYDDLGLRSVDLKTSDLGGDSKTTIDM